MRLSAWVGDDGVPTTPGGGLRPADVAVAERALGVIRVRAKVRLAADVPEVHRPWLAAIGMGLVTIDNARAVRTDQPNDPLAMWWAGLQALLEAEVKDTYGTDPRITALVTLTVVTQEQLPEGFRLQHHVEQIMGARGDWDILGHPQRHASAHPADAALGVLRLFGAVEGTRLTPLGTWAHAELQRVVPPQITPQLPAKNLLAQLAGADEVDVQNRASRWFGERTVDQIVAELVPVAADATPAGRLTAIDLIAGLGEDAVAAVRAAERVPTLAAHVRALAYQYGQAPAPGGEDLGWLATEYAHANLARHGVAAARYAAMDTLAVAGLDMDVTGINRIADSGHPQAVAVAEALGAFSGSPIPVQQLKISLTSRCWRRVLIPENATLELLHQVIIALFGWDDDHLHLFTVGRRSYADQFHRLEETVAEHTIRLHQALPHPKARISHTYDLGASWQHEILLEKVLDEHPEPPECVAGQGDNPIEYYDPDDPTDPVPFNAEAINKRLRQLATAWR